MTFTKCPWKEHSDSVNSSDLDGFTFTASKSPMQCIAARQRWEVGAPCTCNLETVALMLPESNAHTSPGSLWSPSAVPPAAMAGYMASDPPAHLPAAGCSGGRHFLPASSPTPVLGQTVVPRAPGATRTLACGSQPIPPHVNPAISPGLPCLRHRTSIMRPQSAGFLRNS